MDKQKLAALLKQTQIPDTQKVKAVTAELQKNFYENPMSILLLIDVAITNPDSSVRQQAAVQALRLAQKHWPKIPNETRPAVHEHLMQGTLKEQDAKCRHSDSRLIAAIATIDLEEKLWPDLVPFLFNLARSEDVAHRVVASYILFTLLEVAADHFTEKLVQVLELLSVNLRDPVSSEVRVNAMRSVGATMILFSPDEDEAPVQALHGLIPSMIYVLQDVVQQQDEEAIESVFEVFQQFLAYESALLGRFFREVIELMISLGLNTAVDDTARAQALTFLAHAAQYRRMKMQVIPDLVESLTVKSMEILVELYEEDDEDDDTTPAHSALTLLDRLSQDLPPRQVIVPLLNALPKFAEAAEPKYRLASIVALGQVAEGAPDFLASQLQSIMPHVLRVLGDPDIRVRHHAVIAVARLADEVFDYLAKEHKPLMTALVQNLQAAVVPSDDARVNKMNGKIIRSVCGAIDSLSEGLDAAIMSEYAGGLIQLVGALLSHDDYKIRISAAGALGAIAESLGQQFQPYFEGTIRAMEPYLTVKESEEDLALRSGITDAVGRIAVAVGPDAFQPYVLGLMRSSEEALHLDDSRLKESCFLLWSAFSKVYGKQFGQFLPSVLKAVFDAVELDEEDVPLELTEDEKSIVGTSADVVVAAKKFHVQGVKKGNAILDEEDEYDEGDWEEFGMSEEAMEKEIAMDTLGDIISYACGPAEITTYLEKAVELVAPLAGHPYEGCRRSAISTLWRAYGRVWALYEEETGSKWQPGIPLKSSPSGTLIKLGEIVAKTTLNGWEAEGERAVVTEINRNVAAGLKACGPVILTQSDFLMQAVSILSSIITRSHPCQMDLGDEDQYQDEVPESSEYDWLIVDTALDVIAGLAFALGPTFGELWQVFEKPIMMLGSSKENVERATAIGVIAECAGQMGAEVTKYTSRLFPLLLKRLSDVDPETKSNAAYAVGQIILHSNDANTYLPKYETILEKLEIMLSISESRMKDNAAGCICRMIMAHPDRIPLPHVLPALIDLLPLKEDYEENAPVYECIYKLYDANDATIQQLTPKLGPVFEAVLGSPEGQLDNNTRALVQKMLCVTRGA